MVVRFDVPYVGRLVDKGTTLTPMNIFFPKEILFPFFDKSVTNNTGSY